MIFLTTNRFKKSENGIVLPLLAVVLSGLLGLAFILMYDNYIISQGAIKLRQALNSSCQTLASRAALQKAIIDSKDLFLMTKSHLQGTSSIQITQGLLLIPTMPNSFTRPREVPDVSRELVAFPSRSTDHPYPSGKVEKCAGDLGASCIYLPGRHGTLSEPFFVDSIDSHYEAGNYIGCRIIAKINTWWPRREPAVISATVSYSSRLRNLDPRILKSDPKKGYPSVVIAVAPQIQTSGPLPPPLNLGPGGLDTSIFPQETLDHTRYPPALLSNFGNLGLLRPTELNGTGEILTWPLLYSSSGEPQESIRRSLYSLCASPPVIIRQRLSSSLAELLSRNGITRRSTGIVATNPRSDPDPTNSGQRAPSPPVAILSDNQDLRWREFNLPLMNFSFALTSTSVPSWLNPFTSEVMDPTTQRREMYQSLLARMPSICYHLDAESFGRRSRLNLPYSLDFSTYPYDNSGFENPAEFRGASSLATAPFSSDASYFDLLNMWRQGMVDPIDEDTRTLGTAVAAPGQRMLSGPEILSVFGAHVRCPFRVGTSGFTPCAPIATSFEPDIISLLSAWRNHNDNKVWRAPGLFHDGASNPGNLKPLSPQSRRPTLILFLHSISAEQLSAIGTSGLITSNNFDQGPLIVIYIPIGGPPPIDANWIDTAKALQDVFKASTCRAVANEGPPVEENVIIPFIPLSSSTNLPNEGDVGCMRELYPCTSKTSFQDMWECFLQDPQGLDSIESNVRDKLFAPGHDAPIFEVIKRQ